MRQFILSLIVGALALTGAPAETASGGGGMPSIPYGQVFKDFQFPYFQNGELKFTLAAREARGVTLNRAETLDLKIQIYENGKPTTTIVSPKADLYAADHKIRTRNTVQVNHNDMVATAQSCDFDAVTKKYVLRGNVKVTLRNFTPFSAPAGKGPTPPPANIAPNTVTTSPPLSRIPKPMKDTGSLLETPGAYASTNRAPDSPPPANP
jgi:hypothetical protein